MKKNGFFLLIITILFLQSCATRQGPKTKSPKEKKAELYYSHGTQYLYKKDYTSALDFLIKSADLVEANSKTQNNLGMAYYFKKKIKNAIKHLKRSIEIDPKNSDARNNLASVYTRIGKLKEAREQYQRVAQDLVYRHQYRTYYNLAILEIKQNKMKEGLSHLLKSIDEKKDYCPAHYELGMLYNKKYKYHKALESFRQASLGTCVQNPAPQYQYAVTLINLNQHEKALIKMKEVLERFPTSQYSILATRQLRKIKVNKILQTKRQMRSPAIKAEDQELLPASF